MVAAFLALSLGIVCSGAIIATLQRTNDRLRGFRPVRILSDPEGACVAIVPIDSRTGEPNPDPAGIIQPRGRTPLTVDLQSGEYLIEAAVKRDDDSVDFVELYRTIIPFEMQSDEQVHRNRMAGNDEDLIEFTIDIPRTTEAIKDMVAIEVEEDWRREDSLLPRILYVDARETILRDVGQSDESANPAHSSKAIRYNGVSLDNAKWLTYIRGRRLASATEYDVICEKMQNPKDRGTLSSNTPSIDDLFNSVAEWTTSKYDYHGHGQRPATSTLRSMHIVRGVADGASLPDMQWTADGCLIAPSDLTSPSIGFRGVRSGAPRFVRP
jgi:hypothetical protein